MMSYPYHDEWDEYWAGLPEQLHREAVFDYLAYHGDAIDERWKSFNKLAQELTEKDYPGPALVASVTAIEIIIRYFIFRPLIEGAILSEIWVEILSNWIIRTSTSGERELLPRLLKVWEIDITGVKLKDGSQLWETIQKRVFPIRHKYVHHGSAITKEDSELAIECAETLHKDIVLKISVTLGFSHNETGCWAKVKTNGSERVYKPLSPFKH